MAHRQSHRSFAVLPDAGGPGAPALTGRGVDHELSLGNQWVITGQKVWPSLAMEADRCFVLARTEPASKRGAGQHP
jgi:alkylation response protein AidB-like acyl-CoA dehydrogenase